MNWPWVRREELDAALRRHDQERASLERLAKDWEAVARTAQANEDEFYRVIERDAELMAALAADLADLQSRYAALALTALKPEAEPALPTVSRELDRAIREKATGRNHRAALWEWAKKRKADGASDADVTGAILDGDADEELLVEQEAV